LTGPEGGTEIGGALAGTIAGSDARDILLVTDGRAMRSMSRNWPGWGAASRWCWWATTASRRMSGISPP